MRGFSSALPGRAYSSCGVSRSCFHGCGTGRTEELGAEDSQVGERGVVLRVLPAGALPESAAGVHGDARYGLYKSARFDFAERLQHGLDPERLSHREGEIAGALVTPEKFHRWQEIANRGCGSVMLCCRRPRGWIRACRRLVFAAAAPC